MTKQQIKQQTDITRQYLELVAFLLAGGMLLASETYRLVYFSERDWFASQVLGAYLLALFFTRLYQLVQREVK